MSNFYIRCNAFHVVTILMLIAGRYVFAGEHMIRDSEKVVIAARGKAVMPVIISEKATPETKTAAENLARILSKMSGGVFKVATGNGKTGIAIGIPGDFPEIPLKTSFDISHPGESQGYEIKTHNNGIYIIGAKASAVDYAVYDMLYRLGYRKYFPMDKWEIIPEKKQLDAAVHIRESPDYYYRNIWPGGGYWPDFRESAALWNKINRAGGYELNTGHAYDRIIRENKKIFNEHPEYYGLINGKRESSKLCISNPGLRQLVSDFAVNSFRKDPQLSSFSLEPSDGGGWCECAECAKLGTPSDRAVLLANAAGEALIKDFPGKRIAMYAYNQHSPPPSVNVHSAVVISIATAFIRNGYTLDGLISGWAKRKAELGIREYYSIYKWSSNIPGSDHGSNLNYLKTTIPEFYSKGIRYMSAEAGDDWGPNGLGYYLAQRMLWNIGESKNLDNLVDDFLQNSFGHAAPTMKKFYDLLDGTNKPMLCSDLIGRMYRLLSQAEKDSESNPAVISRLDDLALYVRYCEMYMEYYQAEGKAKDKIMENIIALAYKSRLSRMFHTFFFQRKLARENPAKIKTFETLPYTHEEIAKFIAAGIENNKLLNFTIESFSNNLIPAPALSRQPFKAGKLGPRRGMVNYYTWIGENIQPLALTITGGLIKHYRNRGNVKCEFYKLGGSSETGELETLIESNASVPPDGNARVVKLMPQQAGLHKLVINDGQDMTLVEWPQGTPVTILADPVTPPVVSGTLCFYIPKKTKVLGFYCNMNRGQIISPDNKVAFKFNNTLGFSSIPVMAGMDGMLWKLQNVSGSIGLMTVPPYLAIEPAGLLLPAEVIEKDKLGK